MVKLKIRLLGDIDADPAKRISAIVAHARTVADDPDETEGSLRDHLRQAAQLTQSLHQSTVVQSKVIRRLAKNFLILPILFFVLLAWQLAVGFKLIYAQ